MGLGRWMVVMAAVVLLGTGCETTERLEIRTDGSATGTSTWHVRRGDPVLTSLDVDYDELVAAAGDGSRAALAELMALDLNDPLLDTMQFDADDEQIEISVRSEFAGLDELADLSLGDSAIFPALVTLTDVTVRHGDNSTTLTADAPDTLSRWMSDTLALEEGPFSPTYAENPDTAAFLGATIHVELVLPGQILGHDAHEVGGNTLRWSWTVGEPARPGITATWDPTSEARSRLRLVGAGPGDRVRLPRARAGRARGRRISRRCRLHPEAGEGGPTGAQRPVASALIFMLFELLTEHLFAILTPCSARHTPNSNH